MILDRLQWRRMGTRSLKDGPVSGSEVGAVGVRVGLLTVQITLALLLNKRLGADGLGVFLIYTALARLVQLAVEAGLPEQLVLATVEVSGTPRRNVRAAARTVCILVLGAASAPVLLSVMVTAISRSVLTMLEIAILLAGARAIGRLAGETHRARRKHVAAMFFDGTADLAALLAVAIVLPEMVASPFDALRIVVIGATGIASAGYLTLPRGARLATAWRPQIQLSTAASKLSQQALSYSDIPVVGLLLGPAAAASYGIAARLALIVSLPLSLSNQLTAPTLARILTAVGGQANRAGFITRVRLSFAVSVATALIVGLLVSGPGDQVAGGLRVFAPLAVLTIGQLFNAATGPSVLGCIYAGLRRSLATLSSTAVMVAFAGIVSLHQPFGLVGVASAYALATLVQNLGAWAVLRRSRGVDVSILGRTARLHIGALNHAA